MSTTQEPKESTVQPRPTFAASSVNPWEARPGKIALEEHAFTSAFNAASTSPPTSENITEFDFFDADYVHDLMHRLADVGERIHQMDRAGIEIMTVALASPGIEGIFDAKEAAETARRANDDMHARYTKGEHAKRFRVWGCVPMQDPVAAAAEARRCVQELGCVGIMINGFSNVGGLETIQYLDEPQCDPFWKAIASLDVPVYLHPRNLPPSQTRIFRGYEYLDGSALAFGRETSEHAIRLMVSGLFDRYPSVQVVLGHAGEGLSFVVPRLDHRVRHFRHGRGQAGNTMATYKEPLSHYLTHNFHVTCSGVMRASTVRNALEEFGPDRVMFSTDYPFECMLESSQWFDGLELNEALRDKVAHENARKLLKI